MDQVFLHLNPEKTIRKVQDSALAYTSSLTNQVRNHGGIIDSDVTLNRLKTTTESAYYPALELGLFCLNQKQESFFMLLFSVGWITLMVSLQVLGTKSIRQLQLI